MHAPPVVPPTATASPTYAELLPRTRAQGFDAWKDSAKGANAGSMRSGGH